MDIPLSEPKKDEISFKELIARLGLHIAFQMIVTTSAGLTALKTDDWKAVMAFVLLILANGLGVVTAFIDKSASKFQGKIFDTEKDINIGKDAAIEKPQQYE